jgi:hypothetical protein
MRQGFVAGVWALVLGLVVLSSAPAGAVGLDSAFNQELIGPAGDGRGSLEPRPFDQCRGFQSPTPPYLRMLRDSGWDVLRFNRPRDGDT